MGDATEGLRRIADGVRDEYNNNVPMLEDAPHNSKPLPRAFVERVGILVLTALGFVAALAWNEAIQELVRFFFPQQNGLVAKFGYALVITFVLVMVSVRLGRIEERK